MASRGGWRWGLALMLGGVLTIDSRMANATCPDAGDPPNGKAGNCNSDNNNGTKCSYTCNEGYQCSDRTPPDCADREKQCEENCERDCASASYSPPLQCSEKNCFGVSPQLGDHMEIGNCTRVLLAGEQCQVSCLRGYRLASAGKPSTGSLTCRKGGFDGMDDLRCVPEKGCDCAPFGGCNNITNGNSTDCYPTMPSGTACSMTCHEGYVFFDDGLNITKKQSGMRRCERDSGQMYGECVPAACNATGVGTDHDPRVDEGTCTDSLESGQSCQPQCGPEAKVHGHTVCLLGKITSMSFCEKVKPKKALEDAGFELQPNGTTGRNKWVSPGHRQGMTAVLSLGLLSIVMCGCAGTYRMASAKITKEEYESVTDWSRVE